MSRAAFGLAGALCLVVTPAQAEPTVDAGQPCAVNTTDVHDNHLGHQTGEMHGGPWAVVDGRDVTVICELEYGDADCYDEAGGFLRVTSDPQEPVGLLRPVVIEYWNPYQQPIHLGTTVTWTYADGSVGVRQVDFDASKPGAQCALVTWGNEG